MLTCRRYSVATLQEAQLPAHLIAHLITMGQLHRDNRYDRMTDSFQQLVGRAPISAAEFARRHAAAFTPAVQSGVLKAYSEQSGGTETEELNQPRVLVRDPATFLATTATRLRSMS